MIVKTDLQIIKEILQEEVSRLSLFKKEQDLRPKDRREPDYRKKAIVLEHFPYLDHSRILDGVCGNGAYTLEKEVLDLSGIHSDSEIENILSQKRTSENSLFVAVCSNSFVLYEEPAGLHFYYTIDVDKMIQISRMRRGSI